VIRQTEMAQDGIDRPRLLPIAWRSGTSGRGCHRRAPADGAVMFEVRQLTAERKITGIR
jgi:hypothetical protein